MGEAGREGEEGVGEAGRRGEEGVGEGGRERSREVEEPLALKRDGVIMGHRGLVWRVNQGGREGTGRG